MTCLLRAYSTTCYLATLLQNNPATLLPTAALVTLLAARRHACGVDWTVVLHALCCGSCRQATSKPHLHPAPAYIDAQAVYANSSLLRLPWHSSTTCACVCEDCMQCRANFPSFFAVKCYLGRPLL